MTVISGTSGPMNLTSQQSRTNQIWALLPLAATLWLASQGDPASLAHTPLVLLLATFFYSITNTFCGRCDGHPRGAYHLTVLGFLLFALGPLAALVIPLVSVPITAFFWCRVARPALCRPVAMSDAMGFALGRYASHGTLILAGHLGYVAGGGTYPLVAYTPASIASIAASTLGVSLVMAAYHLWGQGGKLALDRMTVHWWALDWIRWVAATAFALVLHGVGLAAAVLTLSFVVFQTVLLWVFSVNRSRVAEQSQEIGILSRIGLGFQQDFSRTTVVQRTIEQAQALIVADLFVVALVDGPSDAVHYALARPGAAPMHQPAHRLGDGVVDRIIRGRRGQRIPYAGNAGPGWDLPVTGTLIGVPLMVRDEVLGALAVVLDEPPQHPDAIERALLSVAAPASLAFSDYRKVAENRSILQRLASIARPLSATDLQGDPAGVLREICDSAAAIAAATSAAFFEVDPLNEKLVLLRCSSALPADATSAWRSDGFPASLRTNRITVIGDPAEGEDAAVNAFAAWAGARACTVVPTLSANQDTGYLVLFFDHPRTPEPYQLDLLAVLTGKLGYAMEMRDLLVEIEAYAVEQYRLAEISRIGDTSLSTVHVLQRFQASLAQVFGVGWVWMALYEDGDRQRLVLPQDDEAPKASAGYIFTAAIPEFQALWARDRSGNPALPIHADTVSRELAALLPQPLPGDMLMIEMTTSEQTLGVLLIGDYPQGSAWLARPWLLEAVSMQIAGRLIIARDYERAVIALQQRQSELAMIEEIGRTIARAQHPEEVIDDVLDAILGLTGSDLAVVALAERDGYRLMIRGRTTSGHLDRVIAQPVLQGYLAATIQHGQPTSVPDHLESPIPDVGLNVARRSAVAVPLALGTRVIGALAVESVATQHFDQRHIPLITSIADYATTGISNARLLGEQARQIATLTTLRELSLAEAEAAGRVDARQTVVEVALRLLDADAAALLRVGTTDRVVRRLAFANRVQGPAPHIPDEAVLRVAQSGDNLLIPNVAEHPDYNRQTVSYGAVLLLALERYESQCDVLAITAPSPRPFEQLEGASITLIQTQVSSYLGSNRLVSDLRTSHDRMQAILDNTRDGVLLLDNDWNLLDYNRAAETLLGVELGPFLDRAFAAAFSALTGDDGTGRDGDGLPARFTSAQPDETITSEYVIPHDQRRMTIREVGSPVFDDRGVVLGRVLSLREITDEVALAEYRQRLQSMVLHDLRGPLGSIFSGLELIREEVSALSRPPETNDLNTMVSIAHQSTVDLLKLVESMGQIARLQRQTLTVSLVDCDLHAVARAGIDALRATLEEAQIHVSLEIPPGQVMVAADEDMVRRVFINLLHNALRFTPRAGRIVVALGDASDDASDDGYVRVLVSDSGPGIPAEVRARIFNEYEQIKGQRVYTGGKGTGLGLTFCKLAIEAHGGTIQVEPSGPLDGATFSFTLRRAAAAAL
jgi:two-component system, NtrC family, sensor histidine kinase KinB